MRKCKKCNGKGYVLLSIDYESKLPLKKYNCDLCNGCGYTTDEFLEENPWTNMPKRL